MTDDARKVLKLLGGATLALEIPNNKTWELYYRARNDDARLEVTAPWGRPFGPRLIYRSDAKARCTTVFPINTSTKSGRYMRSRYEKVKSITIAGRWEEIPSDIDEAIELVEGLPSGFWTEPQHGLGLMQDLRFMIFAIEEIEGVTDLRVVMGARDLPPHVDENSYVISHHAFDDLRKALNRAHDKALKIAAEEKKVHAHNALLTPLDPDRFPEKDRPYHSGSIRAAVGGAMYGRARMSPGDQTALLATTRNSARALAESKPADLLRLSHTIEAVSLERLIEKMKAMLARNLKEPSWQAFFTRNPFVLRIAFGQPVLMFRDQVSVGGGKFDRTGGKISDFVLRAAESGNLAIVEIKSPDTPLLMKTAYREGLYGPGTDVAGAVNQVLDQCHNLQKSLPHIKEASGIHDVEAFAVQMLIVAGRSIERTDRDRLKSFELFRNSLKSVVIVTFDELLLKLEYLVEFLKAPSPSDDVVQDDDIDIEGEEGLAG